MTRGWRAVKPKYRANPFPLINFYKDGKIAVCNFDQYLPLSTRGNCSKCGREVNVPLVFRDIPEKVCVLCAPDIPE